MNLNIRLLQICLAIFFSVSSAALPQRKCLDYELTGGSEDIVAYGMDSTYNYWIITAPFSNRQRLIVNDIDTKAYRQISYPAFSPDGAEWAAFVQEPSRVWKLITETQTIDLPGERPGVVVFSGDSKTMLYSYFENDVEHIMFRDREIQVLNRRGDIYLSYDGSRYAFTASRAKMILLNINGKETDLFEEIIPIGFWHDGRFFYAGNLGTGWEFYLDKQPIGEMYASISEVAINNIGSNAAALVRGYNNRSYGILFSKDYYSPVISRGYEGASGLSLHPHEALMSFIGVNNFENVVVFSGTEFGGEEETGIPFYSHDGSAMLFVTCRIDCSILINGKKYPLKTRLSPGTILAHAPGTATIAYVTNSNLVLRDLESGNAHSGMMVDELIPPRYNWRDGTYETLGRIYDRLYLLTCKP